MIEITLLTDEDEEDYTNLLYKTREAMFYHSIPFKNLLENFLSCESHYIIAKENDKVVGGIPTFLKICRKYGNILNSLPFFGSNGGLLVDSRLNINKRREIKKELLKEFVNLARDKDCILSTMITSPFDKDVSFYEENLTHRFRDNRIAQMTIFGKDESLDTEKYLMHLFESRTGRAIRKAIKHGISVRSSDDFKPLFEMHEDSMCGRGVVKPMNFFHLVPKYINKENYDLLYAERGDKIIAGLLLFYFKDTVEYFTPAYYNEYSSEQGTSLLVSKGMKKAVERDYKYWNFGGTWKTQEGLHRYKRGFGAKDYPYYYYIIQYRNINEILELRPEDLLKEYKWFYVLPFDELGGIANEEK